MLVEDQQRLENLESVLIGGLLPNLVVKILVREWLLSLESLEGESWGELRCFVGSRV